MKVKMQRKLSKYEKMNLIRKKPENLMGTGCYIFENVTNSDLVLPKPDLDGKKEVRPRQKFRGDSYFLQLVGPPLCLVRLIEDITQKDDTKDKIMNNQLILDQPDVVTVKGKVENTIIEEKPINDSNENKEEEILLTEQPLDGMEILND